MTNAEELYSEMETASDKIQDFLDSQQITNVHSSIMLKQEELSDKMYALDLTAIREQSTNMSKFDEQVAEVKKTSKEIIDELEKADDSIESASRVLGTLDQVLTQIDKLIRS